LQYYNIIYRLLTKELLGVLQVNPIIRSRML